MLAEVALAFQIASGPADLGMSSAAFPESSPPFVSSPAAGIKQGNKTLKLSTTRKRDKSSNMLDWCQVIMVNPTKLQGKSRHPITWSPLANQVNH